MPVARKQRVQKPNNIPSSKGRIWYKAVLIATGIILIGIVPFLLFWNGAMNDGAGMEKYLEDKYGQEFKVTNLKDRAVAPGDPGQRVGIGHPIDDSDLTFEVGKSLTTGTYFDDYSEAVWVKGERPRVALSLQTINNPKISNFEVIAHIVTDAAPDPIRGKVPDINEAIQQYKNDFFYSLSITSSVDVMNDANKSDIRTLFTKLAMHVENKGVGHPYLTLRVNVTRENTGYLCSLQEGQFHDIGAVLNSCLEKPAKKGLYE